MCYYWWDKKSENYKMYPLITSTSYISEITCISYTPDWVCTFIIENSKSKSFKLTFHHLLFSAPHCWIPWSPQLYLHTMRPSVPVSLWSSACWSRPGTVRTPRGSQGPGWRNQRRTARISRQTPGSALCWKSHLKSMRWLNKGLKNVTKANLIIN